MKNVTVPWVRYIPYVLQNTMFFYRTLIFVTSMLFCSVETLIKGQELCDRNSTRVPGRGFQWITTGEGRASLYITCSLDIV